MKKHLSATIRHLTNLSTECLRAGQLDLMKEVQQMIIRLLEVQDELNEQVEKTMFDKIRDRINQEAK